jgi:hypothetical protein
MKQDPWQWLMQLAAADKGLPTQIFQNRHKTSEQHSSRSETVNRKPLSNSVLSCILSKYVKNCPVRVSNRNDFLSPLHIANNIPPPQKTFLNFTAVHSNLHIVPSMADITECAVCFAVLRNLWCSRRLWWFVWPVYCSRACCSLVSRAEL